MPDTTAIYEHSTPAAETSTSCTEGDKASSIYTPIVISTQTPEVSKEAYPTVPVVASSKPAVPEYPASTPESSKPATPEYPTKPAPSSSKAADTPKPKPSSSTPANKPKPNGEYSSGGRIVTNGNKWAMTYTPYAPDGNCKTQADIVSDIKTIADLGFTTIRSYSTD